MVDAIDSDATWVFQMLKILLHLDELPRPTYDAMKHKFEKKWKKVPLSLALASMMDPRYKLNVLELCNSPELTKKIKRCKVYTTRLTKMYEEYHQKMNGSVTGFAEQSSSMLEDDDIVSILTTKSDLQQYLDQPVYEMKRDETFDVLDWWKAQEETYPILSTMARDLLTTPVCGLPSSSLSAVSGYGMFARIHRCSLKVDMVRALLFMRNWFINEDGIQVADSDDIVEMMEGLDL